MDITPPPADAFLENRIFADIRTGDSASIVRILSREDIELFAIAAGEVNAAHPGAASAGADPFQEAVAHGAWSAALLAAVLSTRLPGPGTTLLGHALRFHPVGVGDTVTLTVTVLEKGPEAPRILLDCRGANQDGREVISGTAEVLAPMEPQRRPRLELPDVRLARHQRFRDLLIRATSGEPVPVAVAHPCDGAALGAVAEAAEAQLIVPILVGPEARIRAAAEASGVDIGGFRIVDVPHSHAAAAEAVALVRAGQAEVLMKGSLHTDEFMQAVVTSASGLRTGRRLSHVYIIDVPAYPRPLLVTDAAVNIAPNLEQKRDIVQNAIDLAHRMGIAEPRVAILSAVETVNPAIPSTLEAAALCKMADRGQITGGLVDGPLAFDNAVSPEAARDKAIASPVAGRADILVVPDLEAGNMLAKQLTFLAGADAAGIVLGARVPIVLTSRADGRRTRIASCAVAVLMARARRGTPGAVVA